MEEFLLLSKALELKDVYNVSLVLVRNTIWHICSSNYLTSTVVSAEV